MPRNIFDEVGDLLNPPDSDAYLMAHNFVAEQVKSGGPETKYLFMAISDQHIGLSHSPAELDPRGLADLLYLMERVKQHLLNHEDGGPADDEA